MVVEKPYIHFKINNEPIEEVVDYNYTWATTVEAKKGPINTPTYIESAAQAYSIFGIDMRPYFAQNPKSLIMVRVAASSLTDAPRKGTYSFSTEEPITIYRAEQLEITSQKIVQTGAKDSNGIIIKKHDDTNNIDVYEHETVDYIHKMFYIINDNEDIVPVIQRRTSDGVAIPGQYIDSWTAAGYEITEEDVKVAAGQDIVDPENPDALLRYGKKEHTKDNLIEGDGLTEGTFDPEDYKQNLTPSNIYYENEVNALYVPRKYTIDAGTPLITLESKFEGTYNTSITCGVDPSDITGASGYRFVISQEGYSSIVIRNATDIEKIVNRINDADMDIVAKTTIPGEMIAMAMHSYPTAIDIERQTIPLVSLDNVTDVLEVKIGDETYIGQLYEGKIIVDTHGAIENGPNTGKIKGQTTSVTVKNNIFNENKAYDIIISSIADGTFIGLADTPTTIIVDDREQIQHNYTYLKNTDLKAIANYNNKKTTIKPATEPVDYAVNFVQAGEQPLLNGSKGPWDKVTDRIAAQYQAEAHADGLKTLQRIRIAGVFCMYGEDAIQRAYVEHGINSIEPEKGMNNNETCKWRTILLGANADNRSDIASLANKARSLNNQYILFLGHGLIDTGMTGYVSTLSQTEKVNYIGASSDNQLLPYECTQYVAGLRSKLDYGESIFGGQGRKRIRGVGDLEIAPLTSYDKEYYWDPINYTKLNEAGVLTFTEDYGNITLTDGVTTVSSTHNEEDEEGVMNILKYAQNAIYDVCLPYIGRNIDADLENSITTGIEKVLEEMKTTDQTLIDTAEYPAYTVDVSLGSRRNQLLGRIYVYVTICPVHAVRQIEVEMTVQ